MLIIIAEKDALVPDPRSRRYSVSFESSESTT
jgi:hypothetical protein